MNKITVCSELEPESGEDGRRLIERKIIENPDGHRIVIKKTIEFIDGLAMQGTKWIENI
jgi:hypothetical protein